MLTREQQNISKVLIKFRKSLGRYSTSLNDVIVDDESDGDATITVNGSSTEDINKNEQYQKIKSMAVDIFV